MAHISFQSPEDFEQFCCDWMSHLVAIRTGVNVPYARNGRRGHGQGGVDLVPVGRETGIVGQAKNTQSLTWGEIETELRATTKNSGPITRYFILTTASPHPSVLAQMRAGPVLWTDAVRSFTVEVHYLDDVDGKLPFVPTARLGQYLPHVMQIAERLRQEEADDRDERNSILAARQHLPPRIGHAIDALQQEIYADGRLPAFVVEPLVDLFHAHDRIGHARQNARLRSLYRDGDNAELADCLPAASDLLAAVGAFVLEVRQHTLAEDDLEYGWSLQLTGILEQDADRIVWGWKSVSEHLVEQYRRLIFGRSDL